MTKGDVIYAKYKAKVGTWVSASLLEQGYGQQYGQEVAYGAYLGLVTDLEGRPLATPDNIFPGQEYMFPVGRAVDFEPETIIGYRLPAIVMAPEAWRESPAKHWMKSKVMPPDPEFAYPSFELSGPEPPSREPREAVAYWLVHHRTEIVAAESRWGVSRTAIAGVIAWEALENPQGWSVSSHGAGKMHEDPELWAGAVGKLFYGNPEAGVWDLHVFGRKPGVAINYIGAALFLIAQAAKKAGYNISYSPGILSQAYHGHSPASWERKMSMKKPGEPFELVPGSMGLWIQQNSDYLERAVGQPELQ
ncbi:hypothetical protein [Arthrobacter humicola]|uniref:hypothetical protein n=1 Tax=Arthrobacter humicola TaxID=409291 RepID=UPI001FAB4E83|nr:hypothetical protein [Arthrobacter humicola]MCI9870557.1 hypothetical protein [Arthrobacter humicola]